MMTFSRTAFFFSLLISSQFVTAQPSNEWTAKPFHNNCFIENKGQFAEEEKKIGEAILFSVRKDGLEVFFTKSKIIYKYLKTSHLTEEEKERIEEKGGKAYKELKKRIKTYYVEMEWVDAAAETTVFSEQVLNNYYTYGDPSVASGAGTITAKAFEKILYRNMYPNIDVEFYVPGDSSGIKYNIILHKGAEVEMVKMRYNGVKSIVLDKKGDVIILTPFGEIKEHAPKSYRSHSKEKIESSFQVRKNVIGYQLNASANEGEITIDPWISTPVFSAYNRAYDVHYDVLGNTYVYGGWEPFQLSKYNATGLLQWTYTGTDLVTVPGGEFYGDFAIDETNGNTFLVQGINLVNCVRVVKVNSSGIQLSLFAVNHTLTEAWRIVYNKCNNRIYIAGGGVTYSPTTIQAGVMDGDADWLTPYQLIPTSEIYHDFSLLAVEKNGYSYFATSEASSSDSLSFDNILFKFPYPLTIAPPFFVVNDGHHFEELASVNYPGTGAPYTGTNGFNGIAVSSRFLYTYDGAKLKRWNKYSGSLENNWNIPGTEFKSGGLYVDACENIFVGSNSSVLVYDYMFNLKGTIPLQDTVYDIRVDVNNILYACGKEFVTAIPVTEVPLCDCIQTCASPEPCDSLDITPPPIKPELFVPNVFSPNGDHLNSTFKVKALGFESYHIEIFDRWGNRLFMSDDSTVHWNGKLNNTGADIADGTYFYTLLLDQKDVHKGFITLIR